MPDDAALPGLDRLLSLVDGMAGRPVVVLADLVADRFVTGSPKRISREAPVLILRYEGEELRPGGGANAVANVAALGGEPLPLGVVGDDESGRGLLRALAAMGVTTEGILVRPGYRTPTKTRILAGGPHSIKQQVVRYDAEERLQLTAEERDSLLRRLDTWNGRAAVALVSDYGYGSAPPDLAAELRTRLAEGGRVLGDSRYRLGELAGLDGATPNEEEAENLLGAPLDGDPAQLRAGGRALMRRLATRFLLITRGSFGMALFDRRGVHHLPVHGGAQVADVTGAGDTVIGSMGLALAAGATPLEAALLADYAGGVVVMKAGTATLDRAELEAALRTDDAPLRGARWEKY